EPFTTAFLTSPAPSAGVILRRTPERAPEIPGALAERAARVLETAAAVGHRRLVLGAWGCGVFRNDPVQVAGAFRALIGPGGRFAGAVEHVVLAILDATPAGRTRAAFEDAFGGLAVTPEAADQPGAADHPGAAHHPQAAARPCPGHSPAPRSARGPGGSRSGRRPVSSSRTAPAAASGRGRTASGPARTPPAACPPRAAAAP